ncbi:MAG: hypothetical protein ABF746_08795 [Acetobacter orientalis]|uniref:hypothetical protein n=1 Tax=Acetobacter orientalis TaxID=146474 RepID=UPI0039E7F803
MSTSYTLRIDCALLRYYHAQDHIKILYDHIKQAEKLENYQIVDAENNGDKKIIKFKNNPPVLLSLVLGDVIHSLRSSLDYIACAIVSFCNSGADLAHIQFPFGEKGKALNCKNRSCIKGVSDAALDLIESIREKHSEGLSLICNFSNQDKHRLLLPAYTHCIGYKFQVDEKKETTTMLSVQPQRVLDHKTLIKDGDTIDFSDQLMKAIRIGFQLENDDGYYGTESIYLMNDTVRQVLNSIIPFFSIAMLESETDSKKSA